MGMHLDGSGSPGSVRFVGRQQPHHEAYQFAGGEYEGTFMAMGAHFVVLALVVGRIFWGAHPDRVSGLTEVIAEVRVTGTGQVRFVSDVGGGLAAAPLEAGVLGDFGLVVVEAGQIADFGGDAGGEDGAEAGDGLQCLGDGLERVGDSRVQAFDARFQVGDQAQARVQDEVDGLLEGLGEGIGVMTDLEEGASISFGVREAAFAFLVDEGDQVSKGEGSDLLQGSEFVEDRPTGSAKEIGEGAEMGIFAGLEVEMGDTVGLFAGEGMDEVTAIAREEAKGEVVVIDVERGGEVPSQTEAVGDDEGVDGIGVVQVGIGLLEVGGEARVEGIEGQRPLRQEGMLVQHAKEVVPVPAGGLGGDIDGIEIALKDLLGHLVDEGLRTGAVIGDGKARGDFPSLPVKESHGIGGAVDIDAHQEGMSHDAPPLLWDEMSAAEEGGSRLPMRTTASRAMRTLPRHGDAPRVCCPGPWRVQNKMRVRSTHRDEGRMLSKKSPCGRNKEA